MPHNHIINAVSKHFTRTDEYLQNISVWHFVEISKPLGLWIFMRQWTLWMTAAPGSHGEKTRLGNARRKIDSCSLKYWQRVRMDHRWVCEGKIRYDIISAFEPTFINDIDMIQHERYSRKDRTRGTKHYIHLHHFMAITLLTFTLKKSFIPTWYIYNVRYVFTI
jgi:hypothetical protein